MAEFITLSCPSCGHKLQITDDIDRFACAACGNEHIVNRSGGIVTLKPVIDSIKSVQVGVDKTASELAIVRLKEEIKQIEIELANIPPSVSYGSDSDCLGWIFIIIMIFLVIVAIVINADIKYNPRPFTFVVIGAIVSFFIAIGIFSSNSRAKSRAQEEYERKLNEKIQPIIDKLNAKKRELAAHQEIVSRYN